MLLLFLGFQKWLLQWQELYLPASGWHKVESVSRARRAQSWSPKESLGPPRKRKESKGLPPPALASCSRKGWAQALLHRRKLWTLLAVPVLPLTLLLHHPLPHYPALPPFRLKTVVSCGHDETWIGELAVSDIVKATSSNKNACKLERCRRAAN